MELEFIYKVAFRLFLSVVVGVIIGSERARHGRAAGMRTHILVCLGATLTALIGVYSQKYLGNTGDMMRISAQVISGIGFLGAGMIILKNNNVIMGLTTAAGVWTTSIIGIALGCGFYVGAGVATVLLLLSLLIFAKVEKRRKSVEVIYVEINDMYSANKIIDSVRPLIGREFIYKMLPPKSGFQGHLGLNLIISRRLPDDITEKLLELEGVVYVDEEE
jgi:putative Mg2+ transporter-C (MgtC) family protein